MRAMLLDRVLPQAGADGAWEAPPLRLGEVAAPVPGVGELLLDVEVCGVCHTELDEIEGRLPPTLLPAILGHQVVGTVASVADDAEGFDVGDRVGVAWIHSACGRCRQCRRGRENLCPQFRGTGRDAPGGYAEQMTVPAPFAHRLPASLDALTIAPLLCAGAIGHRSLRLSGIEDGDRLGLMGFGASAHLVLQLVRRAFPRTSVSVFARDAAQRAFAEQLGAHWVGRPGDTPEAPLAAIIDTTPAWGPIVDSLACLDAGGRLVINAIRKEPHDLERLLELDYPSHLWMEREIKSVANVTREDVRSFLELADRFEIRAEVEAYPLEQANLALARLRAVGNRGAKVLRIASA